MAFSYSNKFAEWLEGAVANSNPPVNAIVQRSSQENKLEDAELAPNNPLILAVDDEQGESFAEGCATDAGQIVASAKKVKLLLQIYKPIGKRKDEVTPQDKYNAKEEMAEMRLTIENWMYADMTLGNRVPDAVGKKYRMGWTNIKTGICGLTYLEIHINSLGVKFNN